MPPPKLLEQYRERLRVKHYSLRTEDAYDIRTIQELLGHKDVSTTMIYTHVLNKGGRGVKSPLDSGGGPGQPPVARDVMAEYRVRVSAPPLLPVERTGGADRPRALNGDPLVRSNARS